MSAGQIRMAATAWVNAAVYEAEVREGITGHITEARRRFDSALDELAAERDALAARLSGLQDTLAAIYDLCPAAVKRPPLPGPADPPEWEALRKIAALALNTDGPEEGS